MKITKKKLYIAVAVLALAFAGVAVAQWIVTSIGTSGRGVLGTVVAPSEAQASSGTGLECFPGQLCSMRVSITNPNANSLTLTGVDFGSGAIRFEKPLGTADPNCPAANGTIHTPLTRDFSTGRPRQRNSRPKGHPNGHRAGFREANRRRQSALRR
jgi:hypothetical protein